MNQLLLVRREERLGDGVVVTCTGAAHRPANTIGFTELREESRRIF
jgi:hypothetical protein